jgi:hypothetical protein
MGFRIVVIAFAAAAFALPPVASAESAAAAWSGFVNVDGANVRAERSTRAASVGTMPLGTPVSVVAWVVGDEATPDNRGWARVGEHAYMHRSVLQASVVRDLPTPPLSAVGESGRWIDLNLTHQLAIAYDGHAAVHVAPARATASASPPATAAPA